MKNVFRKHISILDTAKERILFLIHQTFPQVFAEVTLILFHPLLFHQHWEKITKV